VLRGCFVTGTDTGVGKTVLAAAISAALRARGVAVIALKPVITGLDDPPDAVWPPDDVLLAAVTGARREEISPVRYGPAVSPHLAAELAARPLDPDELRGPIAAARATGRTTVVEGVGGLAVPLADGYDVRDLARDAGLPLVVAARPGLGTINHSLLTVEAARAAGLAVSGVVLTPWPERPDAIERSNRATIERLTGLEVATLPRLRRADPELFAQAGAPLPLDRWLA
jgi:dethiobiotin synthetase